LHEKPSYQLLAENRVFDLVFVDGDHSDETCDGEAALLLMFGVPVVFVHDTGLEVQRRYNITGPRRLADAFRADRRYACAEDAKAVPGEQTERGLFVARLKTDEVITSS
jgi:hypothetical protein